ncbi:Lsr2 family DNA-binding protein [Streptomyces lasalocidi]|uniref:Lsr2 family protein n=1 Tax=Streptomyces lasalocidi TaxID=324833 RepID=A0A4U5WQ30_STRLS|nr:histone-like nucleoid-structuring protein Lsr2 [Streptomyces lasalocidi]TKT03431.1 Lsr2 family protein [Streptomyces lasalocidi]
MATSALPVSADQKDEPGVQAVKVNVPGVGEIDTYIKVVTTDDVDGKTTEGVQTYSFAMPVEATEEVEVIGDDGEPEKNEDGSTKLKAETFWKTVHYEVDMSPASRDKLLKALAPFVKGAREKQAPSISRGGYKPQTLPSGVDTAAVRRWAQANDIKVDGKPINDKGRVPQTFIDLYEKTHANG